MLFFEPPNYQSAWFLAPMLAEATGLACSFKAKAFKRPQNQCNNAAGISQCPGEYTCQRKDQLQYMCNDGPGEKKCSMKKETVGSNEDVGSCEQKCKSFSAFSAVEHCLFYVFKQGECVLITTCKANQPSDLDLCSSSSKQYTSGQCRLSCHTGPKEYYHNNQWVHLLFF